MIAASNGDLEFRLISGIEATRQRIIQHLRFWRGEHPIDGNAGVPYWEDLFQKPTSTPIAQQVVTNAIQEVEGVTLVRDVEVSLDRQNRVMNFSATVETEDGTIDLSDTETIP